MALNIVEQHVAIDRRAKFRSADVDIVAPKFVNDRALSLRYEKRSESGSSMQKFDEHPLATSTLRLRRVVINGVATFALMVLTGLAVAGIAPRLWGWHPVVASSDSMAPAIRSSDVVVTAPSDGQNLGEGTIVYFEQNNEMHFGRIAGLRADSYLVVSDADVSGTSPGAIVDAESISFLDVRGVGKLIVPWIGLPIVWLQQALWLNLVMLVGSVLGLLVVSRRRWVEPWFDSMWAS